MESLSSWPWNTQSPLIERFPVPVESIQHPLSAYGELLGAAA